MIKTFISIVALLTYCCSGISGQITVGLSTLPDVADQLLYRSIPPDTIATKIDNQVFQTGANLQWDFTNLDAGIETTEDYLGVNPGTVADSFPDADLVIDFIGLQGYAKRNTTDISILGVAGDSVAGFNIPIVGTLDNPFVIRRAPFGYEDQFSTNTSFSITLDASALDTIQQFQDLISQIPGTTADSLRVTLSIDRSEDVDAWGVIAVPSGSVPALKMTQTDIITTMIEIYAVTFAGSAWVNLSPFLPSDIQDLLSVQSTNHLFFSADKKEIVADFTMAPDSTLLSTRYARDISSSLFGSSRFENLLSATIYPNPTNDWVYIDISHDEFRPDLSLVLYNANGQVVKKQILAQTGRVDMRSYAAGTYFLTIRQGGQLLFRQTFIRQ